MLPLSIVHTLVNNFHLYLSCCPLHSSPWGHLVLACPFLPHYCLYNWAHLLSRQGLIHTPHYWFHITFQPFWVQGAYLLCNLQGRKLPFSCRTNASIKQCKLTVLSSIMCVLSFYIPTTLYLLSSLLLKTSFRNSEKTPFLRREVTGKSSHCGELFTSAIQQGWSSFLP